MHQPGWDEKTLVPTDSSTTAEKAFRYAGQIASHSSDEVVLFHAWTPVSSVKVLADTKRKIHNARAEAACLEKPEKLKRKVLGNEKKTLVAVVVAKTPVVKSLMQFIKANRPDLLVMGTQDATGMKKKVAESEAAGVMERTIIPLLLIPERFEYREPGKIVFTSDYLEADKNSLQWLLPQSSLFKATVRVVHFQDAYQSDYEKKKEQADFDRYAYYLQQQFNTVKLRFLLYPATSVIEGLEKLHDKMPYDILAMTRRKKSLLEKFLLQSFTVNMAYITHLPLLVLSEE